MRSAWSDGTVLFREPAELMPCKGTWMMLMMIIIIIIIIIITVKAIPLQALTGPEGSSRLRLPDFKTIGT
jgi:hypothetical protein